MRPLFILALLVVHGVAHAALDLGGNRTLDFATQAEGAKLLGTRDDFVAHLSPFDRAARLKSAKTIDEKTYLAFVAASVEEWTPAERDAIRAAFDAIAPRLSRYAIALPHKVLLVKTNGHEEGGAAYTRGEVVVFPSRMLAENKELPETLAHELFHVMSRHDAVLREKLYAAIGFEPCPEAVLPGDLEKRRITNPDAPRNDHKIKLALDGEGVWTIPVLYSDENYDAKRGGAFFDYLKFKMLLVDDKSEPARRPAKSSLVDLKSFYGFEQQTGKNTDYVIHPEEILAVNFQLLVMDKKDLPSPEIPAKLAAILAP